MERLRIMTLGGVQVYLGEAPVPAFETHKVEALLVYLACTRRSQPRELLADLLWEERSQQLSQASLRVALAGLRKQVGEYLLADRETISFDPQAPVWVDALELEAALATWRAGKGPATAEAAKQLAIAVDLYRGDFLQGFSVHEAPGFEAWQSRERQRLQLLVGSALGELADYALANGEYASGLEHAGRLVELDPLDEAAVYRMMQLLAGSGRRGEALAQYERLKRDLAQELGVEPGAGTQALYEQIRSGETAGLPGAHKQLHGYRLLGLLGTGCMGAVYRARQPFVDREVAVKVILPELANQPGFIRRFENEARLVAQLEHPHIVPLYDYWRDPQGACLVMRLMAGGSLEERLRGGALGVEQAGRVLEQVGEALEAAHRRGVVHRDIKPANILLDGEGNAYLSDFGIARALEGDGDGRASPGRSTPGVTSPAYITPEQVQGVEVTAQTDIYALGLVLYMMLAGEHPFPGSTDEQLREHHLCDPFPSLLGVKPELPAGLDGVVQAATAKRAAERYPDAPALLAAFREALGEEKALPEMAGANPYKGLRAFEQADAEDFYGRETLTQQLLARLGETGEYSRFLAVVGPSGCGKSSAVKAGLLPALLRGALPGSGEWYIVEMNPGARPLAELEAGLVKVSSDPGVDLGEALRQDERGLVRAAQAALPGGEGQLLLVVDQFEEVFTLVEDRGEARRFMNLLYTAVTDQRSPVRVVVTLRADFYDRPLMEQEFAGLVQKRTEAVVPLAAEELGRAVRCPAERAGVVFEQGLEGEIVAGVLDEPGGLPLLQYTLTELYERREGRVLSVAAYHALGGVLGALGRRAEEVYQGLNETRKGNSRQVFLRLVTLGEGVEDTRRRVLQAELQGLEEARPNPPTPFPEGKGESRGTDGLANVLEAFGKARLLTFDRDPLSSGPVVEVAHEALLREWPRLKGWLEESRTDIRLQRLLAVDAAEWERSGREASYLLRGGRLAGFEEWIRGSSIALTGEEREYLKASREGEAARLAREARLEKRWRAFLWGLVAVFALAAAVSLGLSLVARRAQGQALAEAHARATAEAVALEQRQSALLQASAGLAAQALAELEGAQPERGVLLALAALEHYPYTPQAESALAQAVQNPSAYRSFQVPRATGMDLSPDGKLLIADNWDLSLRVLDTTNGETMREFPLPRCTEFMLKLSPDGARLLLVPWKPLEKTSICSLQIWDVQSGQSLLTLPYTAFNAAWSPDGNRVVTAGYQDGLVTIWDSRTGEKTLEFKGRDTPGEITEVLWLPDGRLVTAGDGDRSIHFWEAATGAELLRVEKRDPVALDLSPDGSQLAAGSAEGASILDAGSGEDLAFLSGHGGQVWDVAWSPDGNRVATASEDLTVRIWSAATGKELQRLPLLRFFPRRESLAWTPDGNHLLVIGYNDIRQWDLTPPAPLMFGHLVHLNDAQFSPDSRLLVGGGEGDKTFHVWEVPSGKELRSIDTLSIGMYELAWSPDSRRVIVSDNKKEVARMWDVQTGDMLFEFDLPLDFYYSFGWSPDGSQIAAATFSHGNNNLDLLDARTEQFLLTVENPEGCQFFRPSWSPTGDRFVAACVRGTKTYIWEAASGEIVQTLEGAQDASMWNAVWSPDGTRIAVGNTDGLARVWEVATGRVLTTFAGHSDIVQDLDWSPDSRRIVSGGNDYSVKVWDASSGEELFNYQANDFVLTVDWSSSGEYIAVARFNDPRPLILRAWQSTEELIAYARECCAWRELTAAERALYGLPDE